MIAFDTNALIRMLVEDDTVQAKTVEKIVNRVEESGGQILLMPEVLILKVKLNKAWRKRQRSVPMNSRSMKRRPSLWISRKRVLSLRWMRQRSWMSRCHLKNLL